jgi:hypothetical protein
MGSWWRRRVSMREDRKKDKETRKKGERKDTERRKKDNV